MNSIKTTILVLTSILFLTFSLNLISQISEDNPPESKYWVFFHDKGELSDAQIDSALSELETSATFKNLQKRAIARPTERLFDYSDLPVNQDYLDSLTSMGIEVQRVTKWLNAVSVTGDLDLIQDLSALDFVDSVATVKVFKRRTPEVESKPRGLLKPEGTHDLDYGESFAQLNQINVPQLHDKGLSGDGVLIGVFDTGFDPDHPVFMDLDVAHSWDFINGDADVKDVFDSQRSHGTSVLSVLAGNASGTLIGPAYGASFCLAKTEIMNDEIQQEEDNFVAALEWADSLGCQIVSASLGYIDWYTKDDFDGNTALVTIASDLAVKKGITVLVAAGNENDGSETTIMAPADGDSVIAVGAVQINGSISGFSSHGPTADGRIKPDICANGSQVHIAQYTGGYSVGNGTSFATPLAAGAVALMIENDPTLTPMDIRQRIWSTGSQFYNPDNIYGYGIMNTLAATGNSLPEIVCPEGALEVLSFGNSDVCVDLPIMNYDTIEVSGALWSANRLCFFVDTIGKYSFMVIATNANGSDTCELDVIIRPPEFEEELLAYPNPFKEVVNIAYKLSEPGDTRISIHSIDGVRVWEEHESAGAINDKFEWDGRNTKGEEVANGLYIVFVKGPGLEATTKIVKVAD